MESERRISADRTYVRDRYRIRLHPNDYADFEGFRGAIESDLAEALLQRARQRGYTLLARPRVRLEPSDEIELGEIDVVAEVLDPAVISEVSSGLRRVDSPTRRPLSPASPPGAAPGMRQEAAMPRGPFDAAPTAPYEVPRQQSPSAIIEITGPGMSPQRVAFRGGTLSIGRAPECDIVLTDERISRRHGAITSRLGALIYSDLGSTNGSFVNGSRVTEIALGMADVVRLGNTTLTIRPEL